MVPDRRSTWYLVQRGCSYILRRRIQHGPRWNSWEHPIRRAPEGQVIPRLDGTDGYRKSKGAGRLLQKMQGYPTDTEILQGQDSVTE